VRQVIQNGEAFEERITLWRAESFEDAIELAECESAAYAETLHEARVLDFAQAYHLFDDPAHGAEVFSLIRDSTLDADSYLASYFETGTERQNG
jgi:hypothetical protein